MSALLCLHGAWHGGWVWDTVRKEMEAKGYSVMAPDLPGLGSRRNEQASDIGLEEHVVACAPERPCVLVAHSYAGIIARVLCDRLFERIQSVVLIEAVWPDDGQCVLDQLSAPARAELERQLVESDHTVIPPPPVAQFNLNNPELESLTSARLTAQPARTFTDTVSINGIEPVGTYVIATDRNPQPYTATAQRLKRRGWRIFECEGGHSLMLTRPEIISEIIEQQADQEHPCDEN